MEMRAQRRVRALAQRLEVRRREPVQDVVRGRLDAGEAVRQPEVEHVQLHCGRRDREDPDASVSLFSLSNEAGGAVWPVQLAGELCGRALRFRRGPACAGSRAAAGGVRGRALATVLPVAAASETVFRRRHRGGAGGGRAQLRPAGVDAGEACDGCFGGAGGVRGARDHGVLGICGFGLRHETRSSVLPLYS